MVSRDLASRSSTVKGSWYLKPTTHVFFTSLVLSILGLVFVFEASVAEAFSLRGDPYHFVKLQGIRFIIGWIALLGAVSIPSWVWHKCAPFLYGLGIMLLVLVFIPGFGREINGAYRWIFIGGFALQPIEVVKFGLITFYSSWMSKHQRLLPFVALTVIPMILVMLQPDLGSTLIMLAIAFGLYFVAGGNLSHFLGISLIGIIIVSGLIATSPYRLRRVTTFLNPDSDPLGASFHIRQITLALGNGGVLGEGIGNSRQKFSYIPEASTDSIFAIVAEEIGFVGSLGIMSLFLWWIWNAYKIVRSQHKNIFNQLLGWGILIWISTQTILNIGAVVALIPLTGVPLPFFSYGGSSLVMILLATGVLLRTAKTP